MGALSMVSTATGNRLVQFPMTTNDVLGCARRGWFHAVLDAAGEPAVWKRMLADDVEARALFEDRKHPDLHTAAPYLVKPDAAIADWMRKTIWNSPWGIFIEAKTTFGELRRHLRRIMMVEGPDGEALFFRFYDPRVLPTFLTTATAAQLVEFFGPVTAYIVRTASPEAFVRYSLGDAAATARPTSGVNAYRKSTLSGGGRRS